MLFTRLFPVLVGLALAQDLDFDVIDQLSPLTTVSVPIIYQTANTPAATAVTISYSQSAVLAAVSSAVGSNPDLAVPLNSSITASSSPLQKRSATVVPSQCQAQPTGAGPVASPDTAPAFLSNAAFASIASSAPLPSGYTSAFTNLNKASSAYGYLGFTTLKSYDTQLCANKCSAIKGCQSFNIYFERDPSQNPNADSCSDPQSTTQIKVNPHCSVLLLQY